MTKRNNVISSLCRLGFHYDHACDLRRAAMTLHRWFELECGDSNEYCSWAIERDGDEPDSKPYMVRHWHTGKAHTSRERIPDRETGARKRIAAIMANYPGFIAYVQTDPRGAPLWIVRNDGSFPVAEIECYYSRGVPVMK